MTDLLTRGQHELDAAKRQAIYLRAQQLIMDEAVVMPINQNADLVMVSKKLAGLTWSGGGFEYLGAGLPVHADGQTESGFMATLIKAERLIDGTGAPPLHSGILAVEGERILGAFEGSVPEGLVPDGAETLEFPAAQLCLA